MGLTEVGLEECKKGLTQKAHRTQNQQREEKREDLTVNVKASSASSFI